MGGRSFGVGVVAFEKGLGVRRISDLRSTQVGVNCIAYVDSRFGLGCSDTLFGYGKVRVVVLFKCVDWHLKSCRLQRKGRRVRVSRRRRHCNFKGCFGIW